MASERFARHIKGIRNEEILKAALKEFGHRGPTMRIEDVTASVGIGKGTLYRHFDSRVELLRAALAYGVRELQARALAARDAANGAPDEGLTAVVVELAAMNTQGDPASPASLCRLRTCESWPAPLDETCEPSGALGPLIVRWQADGLFDRGERPDWIAALIIGAVNSPLLAAEADGELPARAAHAVLLIRRAFAAA
jgi:AcrR family transcriptional regulator